MEKYMEQKDNLDIISKTQSWRLWCRLCANKQEDNSSAIKISFGEQSRQLSSQEVVTNKTINKYFHISITESDAYPKTICHECYSFIHSIIDFSERVAKVQQIYSKIHFMVQAKISGSKEANSEQQLQLVHKLYDLEVKPNINIDQEFFMNYENLEQPITPPAIIKGEPKEGDEVKTITLENEAERECIVPTLCGNNNKNIPDSEDEDPFSKMDNVEGEDDDRYVVDKLFCPVKDASGKLFKKRRPKLREVKLKHKNLPKLNIQSIKANVNCKMCDKSFQLLHLYCKHMKSHHGLNDKSKNWDCPKCGKVVSSDYHLIRHFLTHSIPCPECDKCFSTCNQLQTHIKFFHQNEKAFICEECGACFRTISNLRAHTQTHTDIAPYECEVCKKKWKTRQSLKRHMETHSNQKYMCPQCGLNLSSRMTLNRHRLVHSDELRHKCDYCGRAFKRAKALKNHLLLHTGLKPYICEFCERAFANGSNCRTHKKKMHPKELAALEAGGSKIITKNIPKLEILKAVTKASNHLIPVVTKQSGCFAFRSKRKIVQSSLSTINK